MDAVVRDLGVAAVLDRLSVTPAAGDLPGRVDRRAIGVQPHVDPARCNVVAAPFLGRLDGSACIALAQLAEDVAATMRITPDRSLALCGVSRVDLDVVLAQLSQLGLMIDPREPATLLSACVGSQGCLSAHADTVHQTRRLVAAPVATRTHLSGCAKACGAPAGVRHLVADDSGVFREAVER